MRALVGIALVSSVLLACGEARNDAPAPVAAREAEPAEEPPPARCGSNHTFSGGEILATPDGASIFYRAAGPADAPAAVFLHGGPGYNSYGFERAVGAELERTLRMVYLDQRGCGRSAGGSAELALGMDPTIADLERVRQHLGIEHWTVIGHSFGGLVALAYARAHPDAIDRVVLVETTADGPAALEHQIATLAASATNPDVARIARESSPPIERLLDIYQAMGRMEVQRRLHWHSEEAQRRAEGWDQGAQLLDCTREGVLPAYRDGGWTDAHAELMQPIGRPALVIAGRHSQALGVELAERSARAWQAEIRWMEESGHFPFVEEPERFVREVSSFVRGESDRRRR
jgi:proline iminopeptidase